MRNFSEHSIYEFDEFTLDVDRLMLYRNGTEVSLRPKVVKTLSVLVENRGEILSKDELMDMVWEDSVVEESNLSQYLYLLRKTVGNRPDGTPYIETLRRRGYRFTGNVVVREPGESGTGQRSMHQASLIGRDGEIDDVISILDRDGTRLVTITGVGGVGKTTLAEAVAARWKVRADAIFVELAPVTRPEHVISAIASRLGIKESPDTPLQARITEHLKGVSCLLVLDNFEQVAPAASLLQDLVDATPERVKLLVTSRVPLRVEAETLYSLKPLEIPSNARVTPEELEDCESVALFIERARAAQPDLKLTSSSSRDIAEICVRLDGLPLAIELAAARTKLISVESIRNRLTQQLEILAGGPAEAPKRQRTMRETIAWSYSLLSEAEKLVFARLGVFTGGFDLQAAESVCSGIAEGQNVSLLDLISSLVEQNLLVVRSSKAGEPRILMLEVLREFAMEALADAGELAKARRSYAEYYLELAEKAEPQLIAARSAEWLDRLEREHDNVRSALAWARENDPPVGQRIAGAIWRFWWLHGHIREACEQLANLLEIEGTDPAIRATMLTGATFLTRLAGDPESSRSYAEEGVKLAEQTGDLRNGSLSYNQLGFLALDIGNFAEAEQMFNSGLKKAEASGDIQILALLNNGLGELSRSKGELDRAADFYGKALGYNREAGDRVRQTTCLINLGATALMLRDRDAAGSFYRSGLEISSEMEDMNGTLYCLEGLAGSYWANYDPKRATLILGAAHSGRLANGLLLEPADRAHYDDSVAAMREELGEDLFDDTFAEGSALELRDAVSVALEGAEVRVRPASIPEPTARPPRVAVERQGNVLRLVEWTQSIPQETNSQAPAPVKARNRPHSNSIVPVTASVGVLLLLAFVSASVWFRQDIVDDPSEPTVLRLTSGIEPRGATISHNGRYFVYHESGAEYKMWLQQTGFSSRTEIIPASEKPLCCTTFSPDDQFVYYLVTDSSRASNTLYRVPTLGGPAAKILADITSAVSFSPDGREFVYSRQNKEKNETEYVIRASDGSGKERVIHASAGSYNTGPAWSPDGRSIAFGKSASGEDGDYVLTVLNIGDGSLKRVSDESWDMCHRIMWKADGLGFYFIGTKKGERLTPNRDQLYYISYPEGRSRRITSDPVSRQQADSLGITNDGSVLTVPYNRASQIWVMDANGDSRSAEQLTSGISDGRGGMSPLPDGRIAYLALAGSNLNIFVMDQDGSNAKALLADGIIPDEPRTSPGSPYLVFSVYDWPYSHLFRTDPTGAEVTQLTFGKSREVDSSISNDGKWIAYGSLSVPVTDVDISLWKVSIDGGDPVRLKKDNCLMPHFSPDDKMLSCVEDQKTIHILSSADGSAMKSISVTPLSWLNSGARWTPDGRSVAYIVTEKGVSNIWTHPLDGGEPKPLTDFKTGSIYNFNFSGDGSRLFLARGQQIRDAVLIQNPR